MTPFVESDLQNNRVVSMWRECGIQFRSNLILEVGGRIQLHAHDYDHVALIRGGKFECTDVAPDGTEQTFVVAAPEFGDYPGRVTIPAWHRHGFVLLEKGSAPAEILCMWGG